MYVSVVNMSKSCWFAFVLAVICLSLEADAHPAVDVTMTCGSAALEVKIVQVHHHQNGKDKEEIEGCGKTNGTRLDEVAKEIKDEIKAEIGDVKKMITSGSGERNETKIECDAAQLSKQALVSALVSNCVPLLIQQNVNGSDFFNRSWAEFKVGFNDSSGNYWLGNELLSQLTVNHRYKLRIDLQSRSNTSNWYWAEYSTLREMSEAVNYRLQVAGFSGNAGWDALGYLNGVMFSTYDRDNDRVTSLDCAVSRGGGFWYKWCGYCGVNAARSTGYFYWRGLPVGSHHLQSSRMWLQCK